VNVQGVGGDIDESDLVHPAIVQLL
jgi:hypothetical protein